MEILNYPFMRHALLVGLILGILFPLLGIFVVTKGMSFFSDFIAHAAILGSAIAVLMGTEPLTFLIPYSIAIGVSASVIWNRFPLSRDTVLGSLYGGVVAGGLALISIKGLSQTYLLRFLLGDILLIEPIDIWLSSVLLISYIVFLRLTMRGLVKATILPDIAEAEGIRVRLYDYALICFIASAVALCIKISGAILASAMIVIPASSAKVISRSFKQFITLAPIFGVASFIGGIYVAYYINIPSGPSVVGVSFGLFLISLIAGKLR